MDSSYIQLEAVSSGGFWSGPGVSSNGILNILEAGFGNHQITYSIAGNCPSSSSINIQIIEGVNSYSFNLKHPYCFGGDDGEITLIVSGGTSPYSFNINGLQEASGSAVLENLRAGIYNITITDNNGCYLITEDIYLLEGNDDCIKIPNAYTPNGDGINDEWIITNLEAFDKHILKVFNRWGQEVYAGFHGSPHWNGLYNGKPLPVGPYTYILELKNIEKKFVGIVTIMR